MLCLNALSINWKIRQTDTRAGQNGYSCLIAWTYASHLQLELAAGPGRFKIAKFCVLQRLQEGIDLSNQDQRLRSFGGDMCVFHVVAC